MLGVAQTAQLAGWTAAPPAPLTNPYIGFTSVGINTSTQTGIKKFGTASVKIGGAAGDEYLLNNAGSYDFWPSGTGDFTVQWWQYIPAAVSSTAYMEFCGNEETSGGLAFRFGRYWNDTTMNAFNVFARGQADLEYWNVTWTRDTWQFCSITRSSTNMYFHVDGVLQTVAGGTGAGTRNFVATSGLNKFRLGNNGDKGLRGVYIDDFQVFQSTAKYTSANYSVPTAEAVLTAGTTLLLNMNGANNGKSYPNATSVTPATDPYWSDVVLLLNASSGTVADRSTQNNSIIIVQSPGGVASNQMIKSNSFSIYNAAGTSNAGTRWRIADNTNLNCPGQFTFEFWILGSSRLTLNSCPIAPFTDQGANQMIIVNGTTSERLAAEFTSSYDKYYLSPGDSLDNQWHFGTITRDASNVIRFFYDGQLQATTYTSSAQINFYNIMFGGFTNMANDNTFRGYFDDIRLTKGVCRYTTSFTPPTAAFPTS